MLSVCPSVVCTYCKIWMQKQASRTDNGREESRYEKQQHCVIEPNSPLHSQIVSFVHLCNFDVVWRWAQVVFLWQEQTHWFACVLCIWKDEKCCSYRMSMMHVMWTTSTNLRVFVSCGVHYTTSKTPDESCKRGTLLIPHIHFTPSPISTYLHCIFLHTS